MNIKKYGTVITEGSTDAFLSPLLGFTRLDH